MSYLKKIAGVVAAFSSVVSTEIPFEIRRVRNRALPDFGRCRCGRCCVPYLHELNGPKFHDTMYAESSSCFPLCEACWWELTPEERLPFYRTLFESWAIEKSEALWSQISEAVLAGK